MLNIRDRRCQELMECQAMEKELDCLVKKYRTVDENLRCDQESGTTKCFTYIRAMHDAKAKFYNDHFGCKFKTLKEKLEPNK